MIVERGQTGCSPTPCPNDCMLHRPALPLPRDELRQKPLASLPTAALASALPNVVRETPLAEADRAMLPRPSLAVLVRAPPARRLPTSSRSEMGAGAFLADAERPSTPDDVSDCMGKDVVPLPRCGTARNRQTGLRHRNAP